MNSHTSLLTMVIIALFSVEARAQTTFTPLGDLPGGSFFSGVYYGGASDDGSVVVGESNSTSGSESFLWTSGDGMVGLGSLSGGAFDNEAHDLSADGSVVVGSGASASGAFGSVCGSLAWVTYREASFRAMPTRSPPMVPSS